MSDTGWLKKAILGAAMFFLASSSAWADVYVHGYYRGDGAYVQPYVRSNPDGNPDNNWSYPGNVNPYTGRVATGGAAMRRGPAAMGAVSMLERTMV
jgi:hypothetical protein